MLINLYKKLKHGEFELDLPSIYFKPGQMIAVSEVFIMFHKNKGTAESGVLALVSSLVDKSPSNLKQELLFVLKDRRYHVHVTPTLQHGPHLRWKFIKIRFKKKIERKHTFDQEKSKIQEGKKDNKLLTKKKIKEKTTKKKSKKPRYRPHYRPRKKVLKFSLFSFIIPISVRQGIWATFY